MTSFTARLQDRLDARPTRRPDPTAAVPARRILLVGAVLSALSLAGAIVGLVVDPTRIGGEPAWMKPAMFGVSITVYLMTIWWMLGLIRGHRRLLIVLAVVVVAAFVAEILWIDVEAGLGFTSHFNSSTDTQAILWRSAGGVVSLIFLVTAAVGVLALRTRGLDVGVAAGIRWGLGVSLLGMLEAVSMIVNGSTDTTSGAHTVGAPDGGPGLPLVGWSLAHGDLRVGHFLGLHALQVLPIVAWLLLRFTPFDAVLRRTLVRPAGSGYAGLVVLAWWQAERGQALLQPDALTLAVAGVLVAGVAGVAAVALWRARRHPARDAVSTIPR